MANIGQPKITTGGQSQVASSDSDTQDTLDKILKELKKMNIHLSSMTNLEINDSDIGE